MVSRERALEAVRAVARGVEKGELLSFLHETSDQDLGGWDIGDEDNETIYGFIRREAQRKAQREDRGSLPAAAGAAAGLGPGSTAADGMRLVAGNVNQVTGTGSPSLCSPAVIASVDRLMHRGASIGTAVRVALSAGDTGDIVLAARHCVEEGGACLSDLSAFGSKLDFVAARADEDVAVFRGCRGRGLRLRRQPLLPGEPLSLASYPMAVDEALARAASPPPGGPGGAAAGSSTTTAAEAPMVDTGVLSKISANGLIGISSINTGMPNSSGGAVLTDSDTLAGIHTDSLYHLEEGECASSHADTSSSSGRSSGSGFGNTPPPDLELDPKALWMPGADATAADAIAAAAGDVAKSAELSRINIGHKGSASIFTTAPALWQLLEAAGVAPADQVRQAAAAVQARRVPKRGRPS